ncbi:rhomboid family intramembrane serine protease [Pseudoroseicyclus aestuarii]|uniref:Membrane associated rhomboid family serine protease n=1 Tax=Pseudoroseicyclus aestuarii TaxID=1795041 RepID=A0A318SPM0_9RHOB|nr:rhomboid family intramembrane serine protease [Pseudoroseicyclus aestuarii]PYE82288.1 membrane associated rhomboid family serine protease [Pseudoroseicyclus aestuarii]
MLPIRDHNPGPSWPLVTWGLIAANLAVWLWTLWAYPDGTVGYLYARAAMIPLRLSEGTGWGTLVTALFLHQGVLHIGWNMLFLHIFGGGMEQALGRGRFALLYSACGIGAMLAEYLAAPLSTAPVIGASGAIAGVMGGYLLLFPRGRIDILVFTVVFNRIVPVPSWALLVPWFALQILGGLGHGTEAGGTAYWAHAGGFVLGALLVVPAFAARGGPRWWRETHGHPPHPKARYRHVRTRIPTVRRSR